MQEIENILNCQPLLPKRYVNMIEEYENRKRKQISLMRSMLDYGMGTLFLLIGFYFLLYETLDLNIFRSKPSGMDKAIGILFIVYGAWRIYRGYQKNYFK